MYRPVRGAEFEAAGAEVVEVVEVVVVVENVSCADAIPARSETAMLAIAIVLCFIILTRSAYGGNGFGKL